MPPENKGGKLPDAVIKDFEQWVRDGAHDPRTGAFCHGDAPTLADIALVPQIHNAQRLTCRLDHVPTVMRVFEACMKLDAFEQTRPEKCPDAA